MDNSQLSHLNYRFRTGGQIPVSESNTQLIQFTRFMRGNLITSHAKDIDRIEDYPKRKGGRIYYKNGAIDHFYNIWPINIALSN